MSSVLLILQILCYWLALWLGLYLLARDIHSAYLRFASFGLLSYGFVLGGAILHANAPNSQLAESIARLSWPAIMLPALFWGFSLFHLMSETLSAGLHTWQWPYLVLIAAFYTLSVVTNFVIDYSSQMPTIENGFILMIIVAMLPLAIALYLLVRQQTYKSYQRPMALLALAALFLGLGVGLIISPFDLIPRDWLILSMSLDLLIFGLVVAKLDAFEQGETLLTDMIRALDVSIIATLLFPGQVALVMQFSNGERFPMLVLLLSTMLTTIAFQMFASSFYGWVDRFAFNQHPELLEERATLRLQADILPRQKTDVVLNHMDTDEFIRLTRRSLRDFSNLPKLASNPLTRLPIIDERLAKQAIVPNTLERAAALKLLLGESIDNLKPRDKGEVGITGEWRFYNAVYYPYVLGIRPYSRRADYDHFDGGIQEVLAWFRIQVPERTLYNWQNKAAELIAQDLLERINGRG